MMKQVLEDAADSLQFFVTHPDGCMMPIRAGLDDNGQAELIPLGQGLLTFVNGLKFLRETVRRARGLGL